MNDNANQLVYQFTKRMDVIQIDFLAMNLKNNELMETITTLMEKQLKLEV